MAERKQFYLDVFRGGMVSNYSNDNIGPTTENGLEEFPLIDNFDFNERGALVRRAGFKEQLVSNQDLLDAGLIQSEIDANGFDLTNYNGNFTSYFKFEAKGFYISGDDYLTPNLDDDPFDIRLGVINGKLMVLNFDDSITDSSGLFPIFPTKVLLSGLGANTIIESVQFGEELYITTGVGYYVLRLLRDGVGNVDYSLEIRTCDSTEELYLPTEDEIKNFGTNVYEDFSYSALKLTYGKTESELTYLRTLPSTSKVSQRVVLSIYADLTSVDKTAAISEYKFELRIKDSSGATVYSESIGIQAFQPAIEYRFEETGTFTFEVDLVDRSDSSIVNTRNIGIEIVSSLSQVPASDLNEEINACTKIFLYYNRVVLYNNDSGIWYKSDINRPTYFTPFCESDFAAQNPESSTEKLLKVVKYRNSLIALTKKSTYLVTGKGDDFPDIYDQFEPFQFFKVANKGTIAQESVGLTERFLLFLGEDGIYALDAVYVDEQKANIYKVSDLVNNLIDFTDEKASGLIYENEYYVHFPSKGYTMKMDYVYGFSVSGSSVPDRIWSREISTETVFNKLYSIDGSFYGLQKQLETTVATKLLRKNLVSDIIDSTELENLEKNIYPSGFFTDDGVIYQALVETKGYNFDYSSRLKKVKQIITETSQGQFSLLYLANEFKVIDALEGVTTAVETEEGRIVTYSLTLTKNLDVAGSMILDSDTRGVIDFNLLDENQNQFRYFTLESSRFSQKHKLIFVHEADESAKILAFGFVYIYGKNPRSFENSL